MPRLLVVVMARHTLREGMFKSRPWEPLPSTLSGGDLSVKSGRDVGRSAVNMFACSFES